MCGTICQPKTGFELVICSSPFTEAVPPRRDRSIRGVPPSVNGPVHSRNVYTKVLITLNEKKNLLCTPSS